MKKTIAMLSAIAMLAALAVPMSAFAEDTPDETITIPRESVNPEEDPNAGETNILYSVDASYFVTIPASVTLKKDEPVSKNIGFSDVTIGKGKQIAVTLDDAANKKTGSEFNVQLKDDDSTATYKVQNADGTTTYKLGDKVATFAYNGTEKAGSTQISFTAPQGATFAGEYSDTLTFKVAVEDAVTVTSLSLNRNKLVLGEDRTDISATALRATVAASGGDAAVTWSSSNDTVATVDAASGKISPLAIGTTIITATAGNKTASCTVEVVENTLSTINVAGQHEECIGGVTFKYYPGDTYAQAVNRGENSGWYCLGYDTTGFICYSEEVGNGENSGTLYVNNECWFPDTGFLYTDVIDPDATYTHDIEYEEEEEPEMEP